MGELLGFFVGLSAFISGFCVIVYGIMYNNSKKNKDPEETIKENRNWLISSVVFFGLFGLWTIGRWMTISSQSQHLSRQILNQLQRKN
jgi:hypothetical protein